MKEKCFRGYTSQWPEVLTWEQDQANQIINAADLSTFLYFHKFQRANDATSTLDAAHRLNSLEAVCNFKVRVWFMVHGLS